MIKRILTVSVIITSLMVSALPVFALANDNSTSTSSNDNDNSDRRSSTSTLEIESDSFKDDDKDDDDIDDDRETSTDDINSNSSLYDADETSTSTDESDSDRSDRGKEMSEQHRSDVAAFVQGLLDSAGDDRNIGLEVREVAKAQQDSEATTTAAIVAIEDRSAIKTFFLGTDYKNIGVLRSQMVTTQNNIDRLTAAKERASTDAVEADLDIQITALEESKADVESFINENEDKFSLLGWLVRFFNR